MGEILALLTGLFFSAGNVLYRQGMKSMDKHSGFLVTLVVNNLLNAAALVILAALAVLPSLNTLGLIYFCLAGVFTSFAGRFFLFASIERIGASRAGLFKVSAPMFTIVFGMAILGDRLTLLDFVGSALVLCGLYLLSISGDFGKSLSPSVGIISYAVGKKEPFLLEAGVIYGLLSGLFLSVGHVFRKLGLMHIPSPIAGVAVGSLVSLLCLSLFLWIKNGHSGAVIKPFRDALCYRKSCRAYFWGGFFNTFAQYLFFFALLYTSVSIANILSSTEALFNILLVALFFRSDESLTPRLIFLSLLVMAGVILIIV